MHLTTVGGALVVRSSSIVPMFSLVVLANSFAVPVAVASQANQAATVDNPAVRGFVKQVEREWPGESHQQAITVESLQLLATAIESVATTGHLATPAMNTDLRSLRDETQKFSGGKPDAATQSEHLSRIFSKAADLLTQLSMESAVKRDVITPRLAAMRRSAGAVDPKLAPRRQPDVIERFFHQAAETLRSIASP